LKRFFGSLFNTFLAWGPWGAFALAVIDSAGLPVPEATDFLLVAIAAQHPRTGYFAAALSVIGSLAGSLFLFYLARKGGHIFLDKNTQTGRAKRYRQWFHHYGGLAVFIPVLIPAPLPMKVFVVCAGALGMNSVHFALIVLVARSLRYFGLAYLGARMGTYPWEFLKSHSYQLAGISVALFLILYAAVKTKDYLRRRTHHHHLHFHAE
jgi:membrane protein DedA with SNARE-associated domain